MKIDLTKINEIRIVDADGKYEQSFKLKSASKITERSGEIILELRK